MTRRLLFALPFLHFGVGRMAIELATAATAGGWFVDLVTCGGADEMDDDPAQRAEFSALGGVVHQAPLFSRDVAVMQQASRRVGDICRDRGIAAIHAFTAPAAAAGLAHRAVMCSVVGWAPGKAAWQRAMDAALLEQCAVVTVVSAAVLADVRAAGVTRDDVHLILHGVPLEPSRDLAKANPHAPLPRLGVMAHLIDRKGVDVLLRAVARLDPGLWRCLLVAGTGNGETSLRALAARLLPGGRVAWLGPLPTAEFFPQVDLVVVPSRSDALPLVLLQAMAYGVPVVASAVGGIPEAVRHPVEGLLVDADDPAALATALCRSLVAPAEACARARAARSRVERDFSSAAMTAKYLACYDRLAGSARLRVGDREVAGGRYAAPCIQAAMRSWTSASTSACVRPVDLSTANEWSPPSSVTTLMGSRRAPSAGPSDAAMASRTSSGPPNTSRVPWMMSVGTASFFRCDTRSPVRLPRGGASG